MKRRPRAPSHPRSPAGLALLALSAGGLGLALLLGFPLLVLLVAHTLVVIPLKLHLVQVRAESAAGTPPRRRLRRER